MTTIFSPRWNWQRSEVTCWSAAKVMLVEQDSCSVPVSDRVKHGWITPLFSECFLHLWTLNCVLLIRIQWIRKWINVVISVKVVQTISCWMIWISSCVWKPGETSADKWSNRSYQFVLVTQLSVTVQTVFVPQRPLPVVGSPSHSLSWFCEAPPGAGDVPIGARLLWPGRPAEPVPRSPLHVFLLPAVPAPPAGGDSAPSPSSSSPPPSHPSRRFSPAQRVGVRTGAPSEAKPFGKSTFSHNVRDRKETSVGFFPVQFKLEVNLVSKQPNVKSVFYFKSNQWRQSGKNIKPVLTLKQIEKVTFHPDL